MITPSGISLDVHGAGDPVLMLMGFGMRGLVWRPQVADLQHHYLVATYDNRGLGGSAPPSGPFTLVDMARDALEVADTLGWERFHAIGVSMGGMVAQELAIRHPERLRSLSLIATQPGGPGAYLPPLRSVPRIVMIGLGGDRRRGKISQRIIHPPGSLDRFTPEQIQQRYDDAHGVLGKGPIRNLQLRAIRKHDTRDRLHQITAPTLVVQPALDRLCRPAHSDALANGIPNAKLYRMANAGHGCVFHAAPELNQALLEHLSEH